MEAAGQRLESVGQQVVRYGVVVVLIWIGLMKFTGYEAEAIQPLVANSPLMSWLYGLFSVQATSDLIGVAEVAAGVLIPLRPWSAIAAAVGSLMAAATFATTLTFLVSTPAGKRASAAFLRSWWRPVSSS
ncbi:MAG: DUF417 family protein [Alphaproteobacteria bacterium]